MEKLAEDLSFQDPMNKVALDAEAAMFFFSPRAIV